MLLEDVLLHEQVVAALPGRRASYDEKSRRLKVEAPVFQANISATSSPPPNRMRGI
jgi:hypothetical protein